MGTVKKCDVSLPLLTPGKQNLLLHKIDRNFINKRQEINFFFGSQQTATERDVLLR